MTLSPVQLRRPPLRIVVLGYLVRGPVGGMAWCNLHYLHGLRRLGHDVWFVEDSSDDPWCCYDPARSVTDADPSFGIDYVSRVFAREGLPATWAYWDAHTSRWLGAGAAGATEACRRADLLINISGISPLRAWTEPIPRRVLIDTDPVFTQVRHLNDPAARAEAAKHTHHFTYGERIGRADCLIPVDGFAWQPMRQPIALDRWPVTPVRPGAPFATVMQWNSYAARVHDGQTFGMKSDSFAPYADLPTRTTVPLELALGGSDAPRDELRDSRWRIVNPLEVTWWPWDYQRYVSDAAGEFGVAKQGYVVSRSGAFSDRTAAFLAAGRPAIVQDTRFSEILPTGEGLLPFNTPEEALAALDQVSADPILHQRAARAIAECHFDSDQILTRLIERAMSS